MNIVNERLIKVCKFIEWKGRIKMFYDFVTIKVKNMEESIKFYTEFLGLTVAASFPAGPGVNITFLKDDKGNKVELIHNAQDKLEETKRISLVSLGFPVDRVDNMLKLVKERGLKVLNGPVQTPNGVKFFYIEDPNGVEIEFIENFNL